MVTLADLVEQSVLIRSLVLDEQNPVFVKLLSVENGNGVWIESQKTTDHWLAMFKVTATPKTPVFFVPFSQIAWIMSFADYPALSEKSFGV